MLQLARSLCLHRLRKLQRQYGAALLASTSLVLLAVTWKLGSIAAHVLAFDATRHLAPSLDSLWTVLLSTAVLTGRDLTSHLRFERLIAFRIPFARLYVLDCVLAFLTVPMAIVFTAVAWFGIRAHWTLWQWPAAFAGALLFVLSVRAAASVLRILLFRARALSTKQFVIRGAVAAALAFVALPGRAYAAILLDIEVVPSLARLFVVTLAILALDFATMRVAVYSGLMSGTSRVSQHSAVTLLSGRAALFHAAMLGCLRNRSALLLLLWGCGYGFGYTYFSRVHGAVDFLMFVWMVLIFHAYLRGNILGVDHRGLWLYTAMGVPLSRVVRLKNTTLSLLQALMAGSVLLAAALKPSSGVTRPLDWACLLGFAASALIAGEIAGTVFSLRHAEPIERTSIYSGGMTVGAIAVPAMQLVLVIAYVAAFVAPTAKLPVAAKWIFFCALPVCLAVIQARALPLWRAAMADAERDGLFEKLSVVAP